MTNESGFAGIRGGFAGIRGVFLFLSKQWLGHLPNFLPHFGVFSVQVLFGFSSPISVTGLISGAVLGSGSAAGLTPVVAMSCLLP